MVTSSAVERLLKKEKVLHKFYEGLFAYIWTPKRDIYNIYVNFDTKSPF